VSRDPAGSSTNTSTDSVGPIQLMPWSRARDGDPLAVEVDLGLLRASAVGSLRGVGGGHCDDRVGAVAGDDVDRADRQVDGEVDWGGGVVGGHADALPSLGVFVLARGSAWLVDVVG